MNSDQDTLAGGLPHSEIPGSTIARISPGLFAACHVLHRLSVPRHPPDALLMLLTPHPTANIARLRAHCARSAERCPGASRGPSSATFLSIQKILRDGTDRPREPHDQGKPRPPLPSRSHNSLLYNCPSATPARSKTGREFGHSAAMSKLFPPAFGACCASACRAAKALLSPGVEVNGLEPSTSCLQSRRSPS